MHEEMLANKDKTAEPLDLEKLRETIFVILKNRRDVGMLDDLYLWRDKSGKPVSNRDLGK